MKKSLIAKESESLLKTLQLRFEKNMTRHKGIDWNKLEILLKGNHSKLWTLNEMERTGGEPDVIGFDQKTNEYIFVDCAEQSPNGRRSLCYDNEALQSRKEFKPKNSAIRMAEEIGIEILNEAEYRNLHKLGTFDTKTSSWLKTPESIRKLGGSIFGDFRYATIFIYHNGAESYYAGRGFRGSLRIHAAM